MVDQGSGVILMLTSASANGATPMMGSTPPTDAAVEAFMRCLAAEVGPQGVRVVGMWTAGVPETLTPESIAATNSSMQLDAAALEQLKQQMNQMTLLRRMPALARVAETAAFLASDRAGAITATMVNVTSGLVVA
jgi:NAD(P)-dependent dehydrogenase (short-subunit alcohol dehydrogenase family)